MRTAIFSLLVLAAATAGAQTSEVRQPLAVEAPAGWKVEYQGQKGLQFYAVKHRDSGLLMFSRWPAPGGTAQIPELIDSMAKKMAEKVQSDEKLAGVSPEYKVADLEGDAFSGKSAVFSMKDEQVQTMFMISDGDGIWSGQFTGPRERWNEALGILKKLQRN